MMTVRLFSQIPILAQAPAELHPSFKTDGAVLGITPKSISSQDIKVGLTELVEGFTEETSSFLSFNQKILTSIKVGDFSSAASTILQFGRQSGVKGALFSNPQPLAQAMVESVISHLAQNSVYAPILQTFEFLYDFGLIEAGGQPEGLSAFWSQTSTQKHLYALLNPENSGPQLLAEAYLALEAKLDNLQSLETTTHSVSNFLFPKIDKLYEQARRKGFASAIFKIQNDGVPNPRLKPQSSLTAQFVNEVDQLLESHHASTDPIHPYYAASQEVNTRNLLLVEAEAWAGVSLETIPPGHLETWIIKTAELVGSDKLFDVIESLDKDWCITAYPRGQAVKVLEFVYELEKFKVAGRLSAEGIKLYGEIKENLWVQYIRQESDNARHMIHGIYRYAQNLLRRFVPHSASAPSAQIVTALAQLQNDFNPTQWQLLFMAMRDYAFDEAGSVLLQLLQGDDSRLVSPYLTERPMLMTNLLRAAHDVGMGNEEAVVSTVQFLREMRLVVQADQSHNLLVQLEGSSGLVTLENYFSRFLSLVKEVSSGEPATQSGFFSTKPVEANPSHSGTFFNHAEAASSKSKMFRIGAKEELSQFLQANPQLRLAIEEWVGNLYSRFRANFPASTSSGEPMAAAHSRSAAILEPASDGTAKPTKPISPFDPYPLNTGMRYFVGGLGVLSLAAVPLLALEARDIWGTEGASLFEKSIASARPATTGSVGVLSLVSAIKGVNYPILGVLGGLLGLVEGIHLYNRSASHDENYSEEIRNHYARGDAFNSLVMASSGGIGAWTTYEASVFCRLLLAPSWMALAVGSAVGGLFYLGATYRDTRHKKNAWANSTLELLKEHLEEPRTPLSNKRIEYLFNNPYIDEEAVFMLLDQLKEADLLNQINWRQDGLFSLFRDRCYQGLREESEAAAQFFGNEGAAALLYFGLQNPNQQVREEARKIYLEEMNIDLGWGNPESAWLAFLSKYNISEANQLHVVENCIDELIQNLSE